MKPITTRELATVLGVTAARIRELCAENVLRRTERDCFDLPTSVQAFLQHRERRLIAQLGGPGSLNSARRVLVAEQALRARLERQELERRLVPVEQIEATWVATMSAFRARLLAVPSRVAARLTIARGAAEIAKIVREELHGAMSEIANMRVEAVAPDSNAERDSGRQQSGGRYE